MLKKTSGLDKLVSLTYSHTHLRYSKILHTMLISTAHICGYKTGS